MATKLVTSRYVFPGAYIGQLINPRPGNLDADARVASFVGRGSRLARAQEIGIRRSFIYNERLNVSISAPFTATLAHNADSDNASPVRLYDATTGYELAQSQWAFQKVGSYFKKVIISPDAYDPNADYVLDYQSVDRTVVDPLPIQGLRTVEALGTSPGRDQYRDFADYYIPFSFAGPSFATANSATQPHLTAISPDTGNTGANVVYDAAQFNHNYNRFYQLTVAALGPTFVEFTWTATRYSGGIDSAPPVPLAGPAPTIRIYQSGDPLASSVELEFGVKVNLDQPAASYNIGDKFYFNGVGPGLIEFDGRLLNENQFLEFSAIDAVVQAGSTGDINYALNNAYAGVYNENYILEVASISGTTPNRVVTFYWAKYGETVGTSSTIAVNEATPEFTLIDGIKLEVTFGASNFVVGDKFSFSVKPPRTFYQAKDSRIYNLTVAAATNPGADQGFIEGGYSTGTPEGGFGSWTASQNLLTGVNAEDGGFDLPDGLRLFVRNLMSGNINGTSYVNSDSFTASISSKDVIDWNLTRQVEETRETASINVDVTGAVTGTPGTPYTIVSNIYDAGTVMVEDEDAGTPISFFEIPGTRFIGFMAKPTASIRVSYEYRGEEPSPGQLYYLTALYLRPEEFYNNPTLVLTREDGQTFLAPAEINNHLYIMNEIGFDNNQPGAIYIQAKDGDGDGILTREDFRDALLAHEGSSRATDLVVLSNFDSLPDALNINERANDPFELREQMIWVGAPIGTPVGDTDSPDSLVYLSKKSMQVGPRSAALGTRVLCAPTMATRSITLNNGVTTTITLDGSFVAGALAARNNSFADPAETLLRKNVAGFNSIETYSEPINKVLGAANIVFLSNRGSGVYRVEEDTTVHALSEEFNLIHVTTQKQFVTKVVRRELDAALVSVVVPSPQAAIALTKSTLSGILLSLLSRGLLGAYQDDEGNIRGFSPDDDVVVTRDPSSLTRYDFWYAWYSRNEIKRLFGLYSLNTNDFGF